MRLTSQQIKIIIEVVARVAGNTADTYLFGSRVNDQSKGGDVDILIEVDRKLRRIEQGKIQLELEQALNLPVDILVQERNAETTPFLSIAQAQAKKLEIVSCEKSPFRLKDSIWLLCLKQSSDVFSF